MGVVGPEDEKMGGWTIGSRDGRKEDGMGGAVGRAVQRRVWSVHHRGCRVRWAGEGV